MDKETILLMPNKIRDKELNILELTRKKAEIELQNKLIENEVMLHIINKLDDNDKPLYYNELKRKAELKNRLNNSTIYIDNNNRFKLISENIENLVIELNYLKRIFKSYEIVVNLR